MIVDGTKNVSNKISMYDYMVDITSTMKGNTGEIVK